MHRDIKTVLNKISTYLSNSKNYLIDLRSRTKSYHSATGLCCISVTAQEFIFAYVRDIAGKANIELCETHPYKTKAELLATLTLIVKDNQLKNVDCSIMLQPEDYQLLITDALPVTPAEFQAAIRWKIKDLLHYSLNDVVIDNFAIPKMKTNQNKIMVVAAQMSKLQAFSEEIRQCGFNVKFIDIPELGLRNISALYETGDKITVLIYAQKTGIHLLITADKQIYISRVLKFDINSDDPNMIALNLDRLASEMKRSFDYFQSLWESKQSRFLFAATHPVTTETIELLSQKIKATVEMINLKDILTVKPQLTIEQQATCLPVIGGALRENIEYATAN